MQNSSRFSFFLAALLLALGIGTAGYFIGNTLYNAKVGINVAEVKGLAERRVEADRAYWTINYSVTGDSRDALPDLHATSVANQKQIVDMLQGNGFDAEEIEPGVLDFRTDEYRDENQKVVDTRYILTGSIEVQTDKVKQVPKVRAKLNELVARGLDIQNNAPVYYFTKLNAIKPEMLKEATTNARLAANEFAANAGVKVGGIRDARQGGFTILDVGENYGDTKKIEKDVRVVTTITFYLTE